MHEAVYLAIFQVQLFWAFSENKKLDTVIDHTHRDTHAYAGLTRREKFHKLQLRAYNNFGEEGRGIKNNRKQEKKQEFESLVGLEKVSPRSPRRSDA